MLSMSDVRRLVYGCFGLAALLTVLLAIGCNSADDGPITADRSKFKVANDDADSEPVQKPVTSTPLITAGDDSKEPDVLSSSEDIPQGGANGNPTAEPVPPSVPATAPPPSIPQEQLMSLEIPENATPEELLEFVGGCDQRLAQIYQQFQMLARQNAPTDAVIAPVRPTLNAKIDALDKYLATGPKEESRVKAINSKLEAFTALAQLDVGQQQPQLVEKTRGRIEQFCQVLINDKNPTLALEGRKILYGFRLNRVAEKQDQDVAGLVKAAETMLALEDRDGVVFMMMAEQTPQVLQVLGYEDQATDVLRKTAAAFADHEDETVKSNATDLGDHLQLMDSGYFDDLRGAISGDAEATKRLLAVVQQALAEPQPSRYKLRHFARSANQMEISRQYAAADTMFSLLLAATQALEDKELANDIQTAAENGRKRVALVGKPLVVTGATASGQPFNWQAYQGKVVLVDFWATSSILSLQEMANISRNLEEYGDKGFAVVGVNLDQNLENVTRFLASNPLPWVTIRNDMLAAECGVDVNSVPFKVLIDQKGNVIDLNLRGPELGQKLAELLGPAETPPAGNPAGVPAGNPAGTPPAAPQGTPPATPEGTPAAVPPQPPPANPPGNQSSQTEVRSRKYVMTAFPAPDDEEATDEQDPQADEDASNPYLAPEGYTTLELIDFLFDMQDKTVSIRRRKGFTAAVVDAAERVMKADASEKLKTIAALTKFQVLHEKACLDDQDADQQLVAFIEEMKEDSREKVAAEVKFLALERQAIDSDKIELDEIPQLLEQLQTFFAEQTLSERHMRIASSTVHAINRIEDGDQREEYFAKFGKLFTKSKHRALASYGKKISRKPNSPGGSDLVGKPLELAGTTALGAEFDWKSYRGKVVLVDFWATWCGPCRREMPHVKALYQELKDKGFEVVGVSLDEDQDALADYLKENAIPWTNLAGEETQGLASKYGVRGIPTMMLIDQDGNILGVSHNVAALAPKAKELLADKSK